VTEHDILTRLHDAGYRLTGPRRKPVEVLLSAAAPLTAEEIRQRAKKAKVEADLSTIYRNLATFCDMGWLDAVPGPNGERYYQVRRPEAQTMSVLCLDCGQMATVAAAQTGALGDTVRGLGLDANSLRVTVAAHCGHVCPRKEK
jgi:Fe2+ or Zn2+ uptake regulation protein